MVPTANANFVLQMQSIAPYAFTVPNAEKHEGTYIYSALQLLR